jgi:dTDP-glucose 4,6-dehydratase
LERGKAGEVYNIAGGNEKSNLEVAKCILQVLSLPEAMIEFVDDRPGHDFRYSVASEKVLKLGWKALTGFDEGLQRTVEWYRANEWWWRRLA